MLGVATLGWALTCSAADPILSAVAAGKRSDLNRPGVVLDLLRATKLDASPAQRLVTALNANQRNACVILNSDSTGAGLLRWPHKLALWLGEKYPAYTVDFAVWDDKTKKYVHEVSQKGSGPHTLSVFNAGVPGTQPQYLTGHYFNDAYGVCSADLIIVNHGHNDDKNASIEVQRSMLLAVINTLSIKNPDAGVIVVAQNPLRDSEDGTNRSLGAMSAALSMGYGLADAFDLFEGAGKPSNWYQNDVHPNDLGDTKIFELFPPIFARHDGVTHLSATLGEQRKNLLENGDFSSWDNDVPKGWGVEGLSVVKQDGKERGQGVDITSSGATRAADIHQSLSQDEVARLRGKWVTLAVKEWIGSENSDSNAGAIAVSTFASSRSYGIPKGGRDGFRWLAVSRYIEPNAKSIDVEIYATITQTVKAKSTINKAVLVVGDLPFDASNTFGK